MVRKMILIAAVVAMFQTATAVASTAQKVWFCQTCSSTSDAENFVLANVKAQHLTGDHTVEVINLNTSYTWFIEYEFFPADYPVPAIDSASPGTANDNFVAGTIIAAEEKAVVINISPKSQWASYYGQYGFQSLSDWEPELLYPVVNLAWQEANLNITKVEEDPSFELIMKAIEYFFGHGPEVTVVFSDGSTAKFMFDPLQDDVITIVSGSGRYANGTFYPLGGGGGSDGDPYHTPANNGGFDLNYTDEYYSCAIGYEDSKPYYVCTEMF